MISDERLLHAPGERGARQRDEYQGDEPVCKSASAGSGHGGVAGRVCRPAARRAGNGADRREPRDGDRQCAAGRAAAGERGGRGAGFRGLSASRVRPVAFEARRAALEANQGRPLDQNEAERYRGGGARTPRVRVAAPVANP
jgi:hypothetical protein